MNYREVTIRICTDAPANGYKRGSRTHFDPPPREVLRVMKHGESVLVKTPQERQAYHNAALFLFGKSGHTISRREGKGWRVYLVDPGDVKKQEPLK